MERATRVFTGRLRISRLSRNKWAKCSKSNKALHTGQKVSGEHFSNLLFLSRAVSLAHILLYFDTLFSYHHPSPPSKPAQSILRIWILIVWERHSFSHIVPNLCAFLSSMEHKRRCFAECPSCSFPYNENKWELGLLSYQNDTEAP